MQFFVKLYFKCSIFKFNLSFRLITSGQLKLLYALFLHIYEYQRPNIFFLESILVKLKLPILNETYSPDMTNVNSSEFRRISEPLCEEVWFYRNIFVYMQ